MARKDNDGEPTLAQAWAMLGGRLGLVVEERGERSMRAHGNIRGRVVTVEIEGDAVGKGFARFLFGVNTISSRNRRSGTPYSPSAAPIPTASPARSSRQSTCTTRRGISRVQPAQRSQRALGPARAGESSAHRRDLRAPDERHRRRAGARAADGHLHGPSRHHASGVRAPTTWPAASSTTTRARHHRGPSERWWAHPGGSISCATWRTPSIADAAVVRRR